jgi:hypothetical protein
MAQFLNLEKSLDRDPIKREMYRKFIDEYIDLSHMTRVKDNDSEGYYLPHHGVLKQESLTTKLRVVFNASSKTTNGNSLNDVLMNGPKIQCDLVAFLLNWRKFKFVYTADAAKMFRQTWLHQEDRKFQKILWRPDKSLPLDTYVLNTVTYGTKPASFLSTRCIRQLAIDEQHSSPIAAKIINSCFYMDDLLGGASSIKEAQFQVHCVQELMLKGGFTLRKWLSNVPDILNKIPKEHTISSMTGSDQEEQKILGIKWDPSEDVFTVSINIPTKEIFTKRNILSEVASIFDPLGFLQPIIITGKLFIQQLWLEKLNWDTPVPEKIAQNYINFRRELLAMEKLIIPRNMFIGDSPLELFGFADASEKAMAAVIYTRSLHQNELKITLILSKTKLAPVKLVQTIPKLELTASMMLAQLYKVVLKDLHLDYSPATFTFTDSMSTLG